MRDKYLIRAAYRYGSVESQWFVSSSRDGSEIGPTHCPLYGNDMEACDEDRECGKVVVFDVKPYSEVEAKRLRATDLTENTRDERGLVDKIEAAA